MDRRTMLRRTGMAVLGLGLSGGCAARRPRASSPPAGVPPLQAEIARRAAGLPPVQVSWDRVLRTTVGLRPHRPSGFVLKAEQLDAKTVIHNYGHGGAGHSLGWGTGALAADLALEHGDRRAAVIGCGTVGLTAARQLQRRGFDVTIYAMSVPPDTTSNMALAGFTPTSGLISGSPSPEWVTQFRTAVEISYRQLQLLTGPRYGVSWLDAYSFRETPPDEAATGGGSDAGMLPGSVRLGRVVLGPGEHPFPAAYAVQSPTIRIEPAIYLEALVGDFILFGGRIVIRTFDTARDLMSLPESLIVNCSGLGSRALFGDDTMVAVKGQLTVLVPQPEVHYHTIGGARGAGGFIHMMPRSDGIALGGTSERGVSTLEPNEEARQRIVEGHMQLFTAMRPPRNGSRFTRAVRPEVVPQVESFFGLES